MLTLATKKITCRRNYLFSNNNSMEVMQFIKAGMRSEFQRFGSEADKERARQLRKNARKTLQN